jgi:undecaprenyl-diphosphatase
MFFCWALATYFAAGAIFERMQWNWPLVGLAVGMGFLAKYAAFLWFLGLFFFVMIDRRRHWRGMIIAIVVALFCTTPVVIWNIQHGWVTFFHVARQTGVKGGSIAHGNFIETVGAQILAVGPVIVALMIAGIRFALRQRENPHWLKLLFLICIGVPFLTLTLLISAFTKVQVNWPAPAYFTLLILVAYYLATRVHDLELWRPWRWWFYGTVAAGLIAIPIAHDSARLFPLARMCHIDPAKVDIIMRLRGWKLLGEHASAELDKLGGDSFVLCDDYMQTAEMAFYVRGQPKTYYAGSYFSDAKRLTQYDMWPDRRLDNPALRGRNAVYIGKGGGLPKDIEDAFERVEKLAELPVIVRGVTVRSFKIWRGYGFKGMTQVGGHE